MIVTKDKNRIDRELVIQYLNNESYWARERSTDLIHKSIENSLCFSLLKEDEFIGFCRVVTDFSTFSYICDLFILSKYQNQKMGSFFLESIIKDEEIKDTTFVLFTQTAHKFYEKFGFHQNKTRMERVMFK